MYFVLVVYLSCSCLISDHLVFIPGLYKSCVVWFNCSTHPLRVHIGSGVERDIRQICSFCWARWCISVIVSSRLEFRYPSRCVQWCFESWNLCGNFLQNLGVFLAVAAIVDFDWGHKHCQLWIIQFFPQQVYDVFVVHVATVAIQNVDCILKLAIEDLEFHGPLIPVGKGLQRFLGLVDIHVFHSQVIVTSSECFDINLAIFYWSWVLCTCMNERFPKCCVWWCCAPLVYPTCICCQCGAQLILIFRPALFDYCGLVQSSDGSYMTVQCH